MEAQSLALDRLKARRSMREKNLAALGLLVMA